MIPPHQPALQQVPQFQQYRPPPFPQMPQTPNQVHFGNTTAFHHNNGQFPQPGFQQGPPAPPPQYYNHAQFNNTVSGSQYAPNMQNQGFNAGPPPAPLNVSGNGMPTPQMLNGIPATSSTSNTPIRPTFTPQHPSVVGNPFERRESGDFQIHGKPAAEPQAVEREAGFAFQNDSISEPYTQQYQPPEVGLSENVIEPVRKEPEPQQTANTVNEETSMQVDPPNSDEVQTSENQPQPVTIQEHKGMVVIRHIRQTCTDRDFRSG